MRQSNSRRWLSMAPVLAALCFVPACGGATDGDTDGQTSDSLKGDGADKDAGNPANETAEAKPCPYPGIDPKDPKAGGEPWDPKAGGEPWDPKAGGDPKDPKGGGVWYGKDDPKSGAVNVVWIGKGGDGEVNEKGDIAIGEPYPGKPGDPNVIIEKPGYPEKPGSGSGGGVGKPGYPGKPYPKDPCATPVKPPPPVLEPCGDDKLPPKK